MRKKGREKQQIKNAGKFVLLLLVCFAALLFFSSLFPENFFESATANTSNVLYGALGIKGTLFEENNEVFIQIQGGPKIVFSDLCTGVLETILLIAAIAATFEISRRKRIAGIVVGALAVFVFNQLRIAVTTLTILNTSIATAEFAHNILFRVFLFVAIAGLYGAWYFLATRK